MATPRFDDDDDDEEGAEVFIPSSSHIARASWGPDSENLTVTFTNGDRGRYLNVPKREWLGFQVAPSAGKYLHGVLKGKYAWERLD